jgi:hypothetical protein
MLLDTVDNFNGIERLIVIAVGLDTPIDQKASYTRSQLYRAITRAQMMVLVVNEVVRGGWLEFLARVEFDDKKEFDIKQEIKRNVRGNARAVLEKEREKQKEMREKAEEVSQRHHLEDTEQGNEYDKQDYDDAMGIKQKQDYDTCLRSGVWDTSPSDSIRGIGRSIEEIGCDGFMPLQNLENDVPDHGNARDSQAQSVEMKEADLDVEGVADWPRHVDPDLDEEGVATWIQTVIPGDLGKQYAAGLRDGLIDSDCMDSFPLGGDELTEYGIQKKHCRAILAKWGKRKREASVPVSVTAAPPAAPLAAPVKAHHQ